MIMKSISVFTILLLVFTLNLLDLSKKAMAGVPTMDITTCCQYITPDGQDFCEEFDGVGGCLVPKEGEVVDVFIDSTCDEDLGVCQVPSYVPTLSEWGLIAMAGVLGIVGFMVLRRRKIAA
jgi:hypothetical protein